MFNSSWLVMKIIIDELLAIQVIWQVDVELCCQNKIILFWCRYHNILACHVASYASSSVLSCLPHLLTVGTGL